jgi:exonuclease III
MKLLTWNIQHGGGKRRTDIVKSIVAHGPDVMVLVEFRTRSGRLLADDLANAGWTHQAGTWPDSNKNGVFIASRLPIVTLPHHSLAPDRDRWLEVEIPDAGCFLSGLHVHNWSTTNGVLKTAYWKSVVQMAEVRRETPTIFTGDYNTGKPHVDEPGTTLKGSEYMDAMEHMGWIDAWRSLHPTEREFTWYSNVGNGFRLDHAYLSPKLADRYQNVIYSHAEREARYSDHSILLLEFDPPKGS